MNTIICFLKLLSFHLKNSIIICMLALPYIIMFSLFLVLTQLIYQIICNICNKFCNLFISSK